jgi:hypothetical protein
MIPPAGRRAYQSFKRDWQFLGTLRPVWVERPALCDSRVALNGRTRAKLQGRVVLFTLIRLISRVFCTSQPRLWNQGHVLGLCLPRLLGAGGVRQEAEGRTHRRVSVEWPRSVPGIRSNLCGWIAAFSGYVSRTNTKVFFQRKAGLQLVRLSFIYLTSRSQSAALLQGRTTADLQVSSQEM